jgi:uncharacterized membrane protein
MKKLVVSSFWVSLAVWVGGTVILSFLVAPVLFKTLGSRHLAGQAFGAILKAFSWVEWGCALLACACAAWLLFRSTPRTWIQWAHAGVLLVMTGLAIVHGAFILPAAHEIRRQITAFDAPPAHPEEKEFRERFELLHRISVSIYGVNILLGLVLLLASPHVPEFACKTRAGG